RAGRGRMGRTWTSPPRAALTFSLLLKPAVPPARRGWLPLLTGVAVAAAVTEVAGVETRLKWPNDLLTADAKLADILAEAGGDPDRSGLREEYVRWSATIGRTVRAELPGGQALSGPAVGVDSDGRLLVRVSSGSEVAVAAGDVVHVRLATPGANASAAARQA